MHQPFRLETTVSVKLSQSIRNQCLDLVTLPFRSAVLKVLSIDLGCLDSISVSNSLTNQDLTVHSLRKTECNNIIIN